MRFHKFLFEDLYGQNAEKILFDLSQKHDKTEILKKLQVQLSSNRDNPQKSKEISKAIQILLRNKNPIGKPIEDFQKKFGIKIENNGCNISLETIKYLDDCFSELQNKKIPYPKTLIFTKDTKEFKYKESKFKIKMSDIAAFSMAKYETKRIPVIILNNEAIKQKELKSIFENNEDNWFSTSNIKHAIVHEVGHFHHCMRVGDYQDFIEEAESNFPQEDDEWYEALKEVSGYGSYNVGEFYAEVFAAWILEQKQFSPRIKKFFNYLNQKREI